MKIVKSTLIFDWILLIFFGLGSLKAFHSLVSWFVNMYNWKIQIFSPEIIRCMNVTSLSAYSTISFITSMQTYFCKIFNDFGINFATTCRKPKISLTIVFTEPSDIPRSASSLTVKYRFSITFSSMFDVDGHLKLFRV